MNSSTATLRASAIYSGYFELYSLCYNFSFIFMQKQLWTRNQIVLVDTLLLRFKEQIETALKNFQERVLLQKYITLDLKNDFTDHAIISDLENLQYQLNNSLNVSQSFAVLQKICIQLFYRQAGETPFISCPFQIIQLTIAQVFHNLYPKQLQLIKGQTQLIELQQTIQKIRTRLVRQGGKPMQIAMIQIEIISSKLIARMVQPQCIYMPAFSKHLFQKMRTRICSIISQLTSPNSIMSAFESIISRTASFYFLGHQVKIQQEKLTVVVAETLLSFINKYQILNHFDSLRLLIGSLSWWLQPQTFQKINLFFTRSDIFQIAQVIEFRLFLAKVQGVQKHSRFSWGIQEEVKYATLLALAAIFPIKDINGQQPGHHLFVQLAVSGLPYIGFISDNFDHLVQKVSFSLSGVKLLRPISCNFRQSCIQNQNEKAIYQLTQLLISQNIGTEKLLIQKVSQAVSATNQIYILVSGFTSQDSDKKTLWKNMITQLADKQVYALTFRSCTTNELNYQIGTKLVSALLSSRLALIFHLSNAISGDNIYRKGQAAACKTGFVFGKIMQKLFPKCLVTLIGFSMGTMVVSQTLKCLIGRQEIKCIKLSILMGGVVAVPDLQPLTKKTAIINVWSKHDSVLIYFLKLATFSMRKCIGLQTVSGCVNIQVSQFVSGHLDYNKNFGKIMQQIRVRRQLGQI